jgi:HPt (histidine-containing phosphotransfer) domain-containing protein
MMDALTAKFLPRFATLARERLRGALESALDRRRDRADGVAHDLHSLAGEAGLLGLEGVIGVARQAEEAARRFASTGAESDAVSFVESLRNLERAVAEATTRAPSP